jgi:hypothetical protein
MLLCLRALKVASQGCVGGRKPLFLFNKFFHQKRQGKQEEVYYHDGGAGWQPPLVADIKAIRKRSLTKQNVV